MIDLVVDPDVAKLARGLTQTWMDGGSWHVVHELQDSPPLMAVVLAWLIEELLRQTCGLTEEDGEYQAMLFRKAVFDSLREVGP